MAGGRGLYLSLMAVKFHESLEIESKDLTRAEEGSVNDTIRSLMFGVILKYPT